MILFPGEYIFLYNRSTIDILSACGKLTVQPSN
jgi:hypothetical protein